MTKSMRLRPIAPPWYANEAFEATYLDHRITFEHVGRGHWVADVAGSRNRFDSLQRARHEVKHALDYAQSTIPRLPISLP